jgi:hypothetical protein
MRFVRNTRLAAASGAAVMALSVAACGSGSGGSAAAPTTTAPATTTTTTLPGSGASALARQADTLCAEIDASVSGLQHLNVKSPTNVSSLSNDFSKLNAAANGIGRAGTASGHSSQVSGVVTAVRQAIGQGEAGATALAKADLGATSGDINKMVTDLVTAKRRAAAANLGNCAKLPTPAPPTT